MDHGCRGWRFTPRSPGAIAMTRICLQAIWLNIGPLVAGMPAPCVVFDRSGRASAGSSPASRWSDGGRVILFLFCLRLGCLAPSAQAHPVQHGRAYHRAPTIVHHWHLPTAWGTPADGKPSTRKLASRKSVPRKPAILQEACAAENGTGQHAAIRSRISAQSGARARQSLASEPFRIRPSS